MWQPQTFTDYEALSQHAAAWLDQRLRANPRAILCLAAGSTPTRTYQLLAERAADEPAWAKQCRLMKLDEWGGVPLHDQATCDYQLRRLLVEPLQAADRYVAFDSQPNDPRVECERIAAWLFEHGPIDLCVLGLGVNGHLGFNEPAPALQPRPHVAQLSAASLGHAMVRGSERRPAFGLTLGMADILQSREVLLLVSGPSKRQPLRQLLAERISVDFPASLLHVHPQVTLLCDEASLA